MIRLHGIASTTDIDAESNMFNAGSIEIPDGLLPVLVSHKGSPVATALLSWEGDQLLAIMDVPDHLSHYKGLSIGCKLIDYELEGYGPGAFARVTKAKAYEISLTNQPCNKFAVITRRERIEAPARERKASVYVAPDWTEWDAAVAKALKNIEILMNELRRS